MKTIVSALAALLAAFPSEAFNAHAFLSSPRPGSVGLGTQTSVCCSRATRARWPAEGRSVRDLSIGRRGRKQRSIVAVLSEDVDIKDDVKDGRQMFEASIPKPLGFTLKEVAGRGVIVTAVQKGSNADQAGVKAGDQVVATSASMGDAMWEKNTLAGVTSAIQTRMDGVIKIRFMRDEIGADERMRSRAAVVEAFDVELAKPLGLKLQDGEDGSSVYVTEVVPGGSAAESGLVQVGDRVTAASATIGTQMWNKSSVSGIVSAITSRFAVSNSITLRFERRVKLGQWAKELEMVLRSGRQMKLSPGALRSYKEFKRANMEPSKIQEVLLNRCAYLMNILAGQNDTRRMNALVRKLRKSDVDFSPKFYNQIMGAYIRAGAPQQAIRLFEELQELNRAEGRRKAGPNVMHYTTLIKAHSARGNLSAAREVLPAMLEDKVLPNVLTFNCLMSACAAAGERRLMMEYFEMIPSCGLLRTAPSWNILINFHASRKDLRSAWDTAKAMQEEKVVPNKVTFTTLIKAYVQRGDMEQSVRLVQKMQELNLTADAFTYNKLIEGFGSTLQWAQATDVLRMMEEQGIEPDLMSFSLVVRACAKANAPWGATYAFEMMKSKGIRPNVAVYTAMIDAHHDNLQEALLVFKDMQDERVKPNLNCLSTLMSVCISANDSALAESVFKQIKQRGLKPDVVTYTLLVQARVIGGDREGAWQLLDTMHSEHSQERTTKPNVVTYNSLINSAPPHNATAAQGLEALQRMIDDKVKPNIKTYTLLVGAAPEATQERMSYLIQVLEMVQRSRPRRTVSGAFWIALLEACVDAGEMQRGSELLQTYPSHLVVVSKKAERFAIQELEGRILFAEFARSS